VPRTTDVFRVSVRGAGSVAAELRGARRVVQDEIVREVRSLAEDAQEEYRTSMPEDTGDLKAAVSIAPFFRARRPRATVRLERVLGHQGAERDAEDYGPITLRGHRRRRITPRRLLGRGGRPAALKVHYAGHRSPHLFIYRAGVEGSEAPVPNWSERAEANMRQLADRGATRLGRRIEARLLTR